MALATAAKFYSVAQVLFAPNPELCALLEQITGRPCHLMPRGVDAELFHPAKRKRDAEDRDQVLGFVGRLSVEKNIACWCECRKSWSRWAHRASRFLIVGHGGDEAWLRERLHRAEFTGVLRGEELSDGLRQHGSLRFPLAHRYLWQRGAGGAGQRAFRQS